MKGEVNITAYDIHHARLSYRTADREVIRIAGLVGLAFQPRLGIFMNIIP